MSSRASARDLSAGYVKIDENDLRKTGLRGRKLIIVVVCLVILWILALITLICNILLMLVLRMNHRGMQSMQFMRVDGDHLVQFTGEHTDLGTIVVNSGVMAGYKDHDFNLTAPKVILTAKDKPSRMIVEGGSIRLENVTNFLVTGVPAEETPSKSHVLFEAAKPTFRLRKSIKRLAAEKVITNNVVSPLSGNLSLLSSQSMILHASDNFLVQAGTVGMSSRRSSVFRVTAQGTLKLISDRTSIPGHSRLPVSEAPSIRADKLGLRLCVCRNTGRLFAVIGNAPCRIQEAFCH